MAVGVVSLGEYCMRRHAVMYKRAFDRYLAERGYLDISCLVAFSGEVPDPEAKGKKLTEVGMNGGIPEKQLPRLTHERELGFLCKAVFDLQTVDAAEALLKVAAVGLDKRKLHPTMNPSVVRKFGEARLAEMSTTDVRNYLLDVASAPRSTR